MFCKQNLFTKPDIQDKSWFYEKRNMKETRANDLGFLGTIEDHNKRLTGSICHLFNYQKESYITQITDFGLV